LASLSSSQQLRILKKQKLEELTLSRKLRLQDKQNKQEKEKRLERQNYDGVKIMGGLLVMAVLFFFFKMQEIKYTKEQKIRNKN
jgi:hypothetical protein